MESYYLWLNHSSFRNSQLNHQLFNSKLSFSYSDHSTRQPVSAISISFSLHFHFIQIHLLLSFAWLGIRDHFPLHNSLLVLYGVWYSLLYQFNHVSNRYPLIPSQSAHHISLFPFHNLYCKSIHPLHTIQNQRLTPLPPYFPWWQGNRMSVNGLVCWC